MQAEVIQGTLEEPMTALDRCDRCGAQAYMRVTLTVGGQLLFCGHHALEHGPKLKDAGHHIHDETQKLIDSERK